ncbi:MAG: hypothetical protein RI907_2748 [Pseudomonadota bacterium]|jgi:uncharacterized MAPEG superfamily protein
MTIANTCVLVAAFLPIVTVGMAKASTARMRRSQGGYDNNNPREWTAKLSGWQARAAAAQANGFEALPLFAFAVLVAQMAQVEQGRTDMLAMAFIGIRLVYTAMYLANLATLRSLVWFAGVAAVIGIMAPTLSF